MSAEIPQFLKAAFVSLVEQERPQSREDVVAISAHVLNMANRRRSTRTDVYPSELANIMGVSNA